MEISSEMTKLMINNSNDIQREIKYKAKKLGNGTRIKCLGAIVLDKT